MFRFNVLGAVHKIPARELWEIGSFAFSVFMFRTSMLFPVSFAFPGRKGIKSRLPLSKNYFLYPRCVRLMDEDRKSRIHQLRHF